VSISAWRRAYPDSANVVAPYRKLFAKFFRDVCLESLKPVGLEKRILPRSAPARDLLGVGPDPDGKVGPVALTQASPPVRSPARAGGRGPDGERLTWAFLTPTVRFSMIETPWNGRKLSSRINGARIATVRKCVFYEQSIWHYFGTILALTVRLTALD